jgi:hypothetical protein
VICHLGRAATSWFTWGAGAILICLVLPKYPSGPRIRYNSMMSNGGPILKEEVALGEDLACARCGYNLRTLLPEAQCPECGKSVRVSIEWQARIAPYRMPLIRVAFVLLTLIPTLALPGMILYVRAPENNARTAEVATGMVLLALGATVLLATCRRHPMPRHHVYAGIALSLAIAATIVQLRCLTTSWWGILYSPERWMFTQMFLGLLLLIGVWVFTLNFSRNARLRRLAAITRVLPGFAVFCLVAVLTRCAAEAFLLYRLESLFDHFRWEIFDVQDALWPGLTGVALALLLVYWIMCVRLLWRADPTTI